MGELYVMIGIPGSGKTKYAKEYLKDYLETCLYKTVKYVSRDEIRFSYLKDDDEYFSKETDVYNKFIDEIIDGFIHYDCVIADATHLSRGSRAKLLGTLYRDIKDYNINVIGIVMDTPPSVCLERNNKRKGRECVPEDSLKSMCNAFTIPKKIEGFDEIEIISY